MYSRNAGASPKEAGPLSTAGLLVPTLVERSQAHTRYPHGLNERHSSAPLCMILGCSALTACNAKRASPTGTTVEVALDARVAKETH